MPLPTTPNRQAHSPTGWRLGNAQAAIIRPDFTVMRAGQDLSELCADLPPFG